jgi:hypothetical protein
MLLDFRKPKLIMIKSALSASGKYKLFYGHHFKHGALCYDVGTINQADGEIITRHYGDNKPEALRTYHEYEKALTRKAELEERDDNSARIADAFRRALNNIGRA